MALMSRPPYGIAVSNRSSAKNKADTVAGFILWQGTMFWNQTFDLGVEIDPDEIRAILKDEPNDEYGVEKLTPSMIKFSAKK